MNIEVAMAALSLLGTAVGSLGGILVANKLSNHRIDDVKGEIEA